MMWIEFQALPASEWLCLQPSQQYHCPADTVVGEAQHIPKSVGKHSSLCFPSARVLLAMEILKRTDDMDDSGIVWLNTVMLKATF